VNKFILVLAAGLMVASCQQDKASDEGSKSNTSEQSQNTNGETEGPEMTPEETSAYAVGASMADSVLNIQEKFPSLNINLETIKQGFMEQLKQESKLTKEEIQQEVMTFQQKLRDTQMKQMEEENTKRAAENKTFLEGNIAKGFTQTESGLQYKVVEAGKSDKKPTATDSVKVHYTGTFINGEKFDSSVDRKQPFEFSLKGGVIEGWLEGVKLMTVGSKYQFVVPPELGYGSQNRGPIPGNSVLIFDVELLEIVEAPKEEEPKK